MLRLGPGSHGNLAQLPSLCLLDLAAPAAGACAGPEKDKESTSWIKSWGTK